MAYAVEPVGPTRTTVTGRAAPGDLMFRGAGAPRAPRSDFLDAAGLAPAQVDPELLRRAEHLGVGLAQVDLRAVAGEHLDVQAQGLHLLDEHLERLGDARLGDVVALDDRLVDLHAAGDVVGLDGEQLLQRVGGAVRLHGPHLHLTEPLATELGLTAQRLLGDHRVRAGAARVDLVVHEVVQLEDVHVADRDLVRERLAAAAVEQPGLAVATDEALAVATRVGRLQQARDLLLGGTVEHRAGHPGPRRDLTGLLRDVPGPLGVADDLPALCGGPAQVRLQDLADVHPAGHAQRVEHDVDRRAVLEERHVLDRQDLGDDALVAVAAGELVTVGDLALVGDVDAHQLVDTRRQLVTLLAVEHLHADDRAGLTVRHLHRGVAHLAGLLTEDGAQQALLRGQLGLTLGGHLADQQVAVADLGADADDAALVEVGQDLLGDVRDVPGDLLRTQLGVTGVDLVLLDVDRGEHVLLHQALAEDDRVLVVVALPRHERHEQVAAQRHLAAVGRRTVGDDVTGLDPVARGDPDLLVVAVALVGAGELGDPVGLPGAVVVGHGDQVGGDLLHDTGLLGADDVTGVERGAVLHAGAHQRGLGMEYRAGGARHGVPRRAGAHQRGLGADERHRL